MTNMPPSGSNLRGAVDLSSLVNRAPTGAPPVSTNGAPVTGAPVGGAPAPSGPVMVPSLVIDGTDANFGELLELSSRVPVIVGLWASRSEPSTQLLAVLEKLITGLDGRFVLARVDIDANPQLVQAFQAQTVPTVAAVITGQPVQLFNGPLGEEQIAELLVRVLELAAQQGVTGTAEAADANAGTEPAVAVDEPLPPHHLEAYTAIEAGDYATAQSEYRTALAQNPNDTMAVAGLAQVSLLARLQGKTIDQIRNGAASAPDDLDAQLLVADLDLSGGHIEDAFDRLLGLFPAQPAPGRNAIRERILELFEVVGQDDPRVPPTRSRLTALLY
ncbi:tetratricopeptide repeat protein [Cryobacterium sp. TMT1-2-2]|uniref:tetratricopeptide repeat protein n=1 Tax=Cryobacterium sp. TMT1-2-2 TaxID=1259233 RepID=UPI00106A1051|nr:tetratricopeptide repeat protein [Cryobacterium sp. TMT1-2-2]TFD11833.1 tetratricopeptide repeat protein [Cryobacterium sp. TMT1-2-2]